jgi:hypothetical protein
MTIRHARITTAAALALLCTVGCKKQDTTSPDADASPPDTEVEAEPEPEEPEPEEPETVILTKANFDETINEHMQEVSDCYVGLLADNPDLKGTLDAEFTITSEGRATAVIAAEGSTLNDEKLVTCINEAAANWTFPVASEPEMKLRYQFALEPAE